MAWYQRQAEGVGCVSPRSGDPDSECSDTASTGTTAWYRQRDEEAGSTSHWHGDLDPEYPDTEGTGEEVGSASSSSGDLNPGEAGRIPLRMLHPPGQMHLLLGCSIARDAGLEARDQDDMVLNLAVGGNTWAKVAGHLDGDLRTWREAAASFGRELGKVILWLSGNEAYDRETGANLLIDAPRGPLEAIIQGVLHAVRAVASPVVLGPLPRFWVDRMLPWEHTAAYALDRKEKEAATAEEFCSLGKSFTTKMKKRHVILDKARAWFRRDGIHLTREGYLKVAATGVFPAWLRVDDSWDA